MAIVEWAHGLVCESVEHDAETHEWVFRFGGGATLRVAAPWRIAGPDRIELGHEDDGQWFGQARPVDGVEAATRLLGSRSVMRFEVAPVSADASIAFDGELALQIFNDSSGYEGWILAAPARGQVIGQGGGTAVALPGQDLSPPPTA